MRKQHQNDIESSHKTNSIPFYSTLSIFTFLLLSSPHTNTRSNNNIYFKRTLFTFHTHKGKKKKKNTKHFADKMNNNEIGKDKALEEICFSEESPLHQSPKARYVAEQEQHLLKVNAKKAGDTYSIRMIFFPIIVAVIVGLLFYSVDVTKNNGKGSTRRNSKRWKKDATTVGGDTLNKDSEKSGMSKSASLSEKGEM